MAKPSKASNFFKTLLTILLVLIIVVAVGINVAFLKTSSAPSLFGNSVYIMQQDNMGKVPYGDAVISNSKEVANLEVGNTVLCLTSFDNEFKEVLKLTNIAQEDGTTYYYVQADNETATDALKLTQDKIVAKCLWTNSSLGKAITFAKTTLGIIILVLVPCAILLIMNILSTIAKNKQEQQQEEDLRKNNLKNTKKSPNKKKKSIQDTTNEDDETPTKQSKPKKKKVSTSSNTEELSLNKKISNSKSIPVKKLSEEESIKQREDISNMIGSELTDNPLRERTREFNSAELNVSAMKNLNAIKINEDDILADEDVHSPNMNEKADKIRKALSGETPKENEVKPVEKVSKVETPTTPIKKEINTHPTINRDVENAVVIIPETKVHPSKEITEEKVKKFSFNEDDFLKDIIGEEDTVTSSNNSTVSDDFLDQLLSTIPSTHPTQEVRKTPVNYGTPKPVRKVTHKPEHKVSKSIKTPKITNKIVDNTSFDELIKAIEKEKNSIR